MVVRRQQLRLPQVKSEEAYDVRQTVEGAFTPEHIEKRAKVIPLSVRVRAESGLFPGETRYCYQALQTDRPFALTKQAELLRTPPLAL